MKEIIMNENLKSKTEFQESDDSSDDGEKVFKVRQSLLNEMFLAQNDVKSAFNLCFSIVIVLFGTTLVYYIIDPTEFYDDINFLGWCFGASQFHILSFAWLKMQLSAILILYPLMRIWLLLRSQEIEIIKKWNIYITSVFQIIYQSILFIFCLNVIMENNFSPVCACALIMEQIRLFMKVHSFIQENKDRKIEFEKEKPKIIAPTLSQFLYFLNAPTLLYRDNYPREQTIRWKLVLWYFVQCISCIFCTFAISRRFIQANFQNIGKDSYTIKEIYYLIFTGSLIGMQLKLLLFYGFFHCWLNAFAEIMRFGDREFYKDWWNATTYGRFYREWNVVVYDWLYQYIYKFSIKVTSGNRGSSALSVFMISAVIHEYILAVSFGYFIPVMFILFAGIGVMFFFVGKIQGQNQTPPKISKVESSSLSMKRSPQSLSLSIGNMFVFTTLYIGWSLMLTLYSMEWYSRINCPIVNKSLWNFVIPRFFTCAVIA